MGARRGARAPARGGQRRTDGRSVRSYHSNTRRPASRRTVLRFARDTSALRSAGPLRNSNSPRVGRGARAPRAVVSGGGREPGSFLATLARTSRGAGRRGGHAVGPPPSGPAWHLEGGAMPAGVALPVQWRQQGRGCTVACETMARLIDSPTVTRCDDESQPCRTECRLSLCGATGRRCPRVEWRRRFFYG